MRSHEGSRNRVAMELDDEVERLRKWRHETDKTLYSITLRLDQLHKDMTALSPEVHRLTDADRINQEVAKRIKTQNTLRLTNWQRLGAFVVGVAAVADTIVRLVTHG